MNPAPAFYVVNYSPSPRMATGRKDNCILPVDFDETQKLKEIAARLYEAGKSQYDATVTKEVIEKQVFEICFNHANDSIYKKNNPFFELGCGGFTVFLQLESNGEKYFSVFEKVAKENLQK